MVIEQPKQLNTTSEKLEAIIDQFLRNSTCTNKKEEKEFLLKLLGNKRLVTTLLFKGSIHGWSAKEFHSRCDDRGPTISLFKIKDGDCIGGYTNAQWKSCSGKYVSDKFAMLFNLSFQRYFPNLGSGKEIYCHNSCGPCFRGGEGSELGASNEPFNSDNYCISYANKTGYGIQVDGAGTNMLSNKKDKWFTISELEVWEVKYLE